MKKNWCFGGHRRLSRELPAIMKFAMILILFAAYRLSKSLTDILIKDV